MGEEEVAVAVCLLHNHKALTLPSYQLTAYIDLLVDLQETEVEEPGEEEQKQRELESGCLGTSVAYQSMVQVACCSMSAAVMG